MSEIKLNDPPKGYEWARIEDVAEEERYLYTQHYKAPIVVTEFTKDSQEFWREVLGICLRKVEPRKPRECVETVEWSAHSPGAKMARVPISWEIGTRVRVTEILEEE